MVFDEMGEPVSVETVKSGVGGDGDSAADGGAGPAADGGAGPAADGGAGPAADGGAGPAEWEDDRPSGGRSVSLH